MTCLEKYLAEHSDRKTDVFDIIAVSCPSDCEYADDPKWCDDYGEYRCVKCWMREIPETTETKKENNEMCYTDCADVAALKKEIEQRDKDISELKKKLEDRYEGYCCSISDRDNEIEKLESELVKKDCQIANQAKLIDGYMKTNAENIVRIRDLRETNEELAAERTKVERLEGMVAIRDEEIDKLVKEIEEFEEAIKAKNKRIAELCARIDKLDEARYIEQDIEMTKQLAEKFNSCNNSCALHPTDIARTIARHMRNKYDALIYVGFSHDDAMALIPMWTD